MKDRLHSADSSEHGATPQDPFAGVCGHPLSQAGHARHDEILADILSRSPAIRRSRAARRSVRAAAPIVLVALMVVGVRTLLPGAQRSLPAPTDLRPIVLGNSGPEAAPGLSAETPVGSFPSQQSSSPSARVVRIVSTADTSFVDRIVTSRNRGAVGGNTVVQTIDDQTLMSLLAQEGRSDGIVRIGDRTMLASDLARENPAMPSPAGPSGLPIPAAPLLPGL